MAPDRAVSKVDVSASVRYPVTGPEGTQTLFIHVSDRQGQPVEGVALKVTARRPSGRQPLELPPTDGRGFAMERFQILPTPPGERVIIDVTVWQPDLEAATRTLFLPWW